jgi:Tfp pilus assembly protein PilV
MNRKQFIILLVLVIVIGVAGWIIRQHNASSWQSGGQILGRKLLPDLAVNDIAQIIVKSGTNQLNLAKRDNLWRVRERGNYPANFSQISELLLKFADLKIVQSEEIGPSQLGRFDLLPPGTATNSSSQVEFKDQSGKTLNSVLLGKMHMRKPAENSQLGGMGDAGWPDGRYVMADAGAKMVAVISDPLDGVQTKPEQWLNKEFLSIEKPRAIAVQYPEATNSWKLTRASETNDWRLADARTDEKLDSSKISSVTTPFRSTSFNDVALLDVSNSINNIMMTVETFDGFTYVAKIGQKQAENYPVNFSITTNPAAERAVVKDEKAEDKARLDKEFKEQQGKLAEKLAKERQFENWIYYLPAYSVDEILKTRGQLLAEVKTNTLAEPQK